MPVPDPALSRAVLIGIGKYTHRDLGSLPAAAAGAKRLAAVLRDPTVWGLPAEHVTVLGAEASRERILAAVRDAAHQATDTLLVYFAGHGLRNRTRDRLYLALADADEDHPQVGGLSYLELRDVVRQAGYRVRYRITVLDCCYSGLAGAMSATAAPSRADLADVLDEPRELAAEPDDYGDCVLTSAPPTMPSFALPGADYPEFTGELIGILEDGIRDAGPALSVDDIWLRVRRRLSERGSPEPQQFAQNTVARQVQFHNRFGVRGRRSMRFADRIHATQRKNSTSALSLESLAVNPRGNGNPRGQVVSRVVNPLRSSPKRAGGTRSETRLQNGQNSPPKARVRVDPPRRVQSFTGAPSLWRAAWTFRLVLLLIGLATSMAGITLATGHYRELAQYPHVPLCKSGARSDQECIKVETGQVTAKRLLSDNGAYGLTVKQASGTTEEHVVSFDVNHAARIGSRAEIKFWRGEVVEVSVRGESEEYVSVSGAGWGYSFLAWYGIGFVTWALLKRTRGLGRGVFALASAAWGFAGIFLILGVNFLVLDVLA
ncbi:caspase domain-containing protein [Streptomyces tibetensis]|uniref:Caspase domain-containing protein n=1 Tax=Streptomyces tibetensis TaxID=2382123 RepID=A0ABW6N5Z4_9ACTN